MTLMPPDADTEFWRFQQPLTGLFLQVAAVRPVEEDGAAVYDVAGTLLLDVEEGVRCLSENVSMTLTSEDWLRVLDARCGEHQATPEVLVELRVVPA